MSAPESIKQLVERFEANREAYRSSRYNETQTRREFIDPFFKIQHIPSSNSLNQLLRSRRKGAARPDGGAGQAHAGAVQAAAVHIAGEGDAQARDRGDGSSDR